MDGAGLSGDARRLLLVLSLYGATPKGGKVWVKEFTLRAVVFQGVRSGLFTDYDLGLGMVHYHGNDYFAMYSQEAEGDLEKLFAQGLIQKVILNTRFYTPEIAYRLAGNAYPLLKDPDFLSPANRTAVRGLVTCRHCNERCCDYVGISSVGGSGTEKYRGRRLYRVCSCYRAKARHRDYPIRLLPQDEYLPDFFSIGDSEYYGKPLFVENINEW